MSDKLLQSVRQHGTPMRDMRPVSERYVPSLRPEPLAFAPRHSHSHLRPGAPCLCPAQPRSAGTCLHGRRARPLPSPHASTLSLRSSANEHAISSANAAMTGSQRSCACKGRVPRRACGGEGHQTVPAGGLVPGQVRGEARSIQCRDKSSFKTGVARAPPPRPSGLPGLPPPPLGRPVPGPAGCTAPPPEAASLFARRQDIESTQCRDRSSFKTGVAAMRPWSLPRCPSQDS